MWWRIIATELLIPIVKFTINRLINTRNKALDKGKDKVIDYTNRKAEELKSKLDKLGQ